MANLGVTEALSVPTVEVFAFQEMDNTSGKPQNDKPIFSAITSLMKAQAYEMSALPARKKAPSIYQFNLLSVVDANLVRLMFNGATINCTPLQDEHYLARYIVRKRETFSRIRFIKAGAFSSALQDYGRLHLANCAWFGSECDAFYADLVKDWKRVEVLAEDFKSKIQWFVSWRLERQFRRPIDIGTISLHWNKSTNAVWIGVTESPDVLEFIKADAEIKAHVSKALKTIFRYEGDFEFDDDIPF